MGSLSSLCVEPFLTSSQNFSFPRKLNPLSDDLTDRFLSQDNISGGEQAVAAGRRCA